MSLKLNIAANYASQLYVTLVGIVLIPIYLVRMGTEAYGLVGFFAMLQVLFNLLDFGLAPTIARETARYQGGAISPVEYRRLYRSLSIVFAFIAVPGGAILFGMADIVAKHWLNVKNLQHDQVLYSLQIMAVSVALRWMGGLYRGVISGSEKLVWLSGFNAMFVTLRFVGVLVSMSIWGYTATVFFLHQLVVALLELAFLLAKCLVLLPRTQIANERIGWSFRPIQPLLGFALTIAFTSSVWVLITQIDKLILSGILPLAEYGYFTIAVLVAGGITIITGPISSALLPRLARLHAEGEHDAIIRIYNDATQLTTVIAGSVAVTLFFGSESLLFAWTGSREVTEATAPILRLYAVGNGFLALSAFPFYLQYARGNLRFHLIGNIVMLIALVPVIIVVSMKAGAIGAGWVWAVSNTLYLIVWTGYVHHKLEPGLHWRWIVSNLVVICLPTSLFGMMLGQIECEFESRAKELLQSVMLFSACICVAILSSRYLRQMILQKVLSR